MKEEKNVKNKWVHLRLSEEDYDQIQHQFCKTTERNFSNYARKIMLGKPMIQGHRNLSLDNQVRELTGLLSNLNGIANNFNQAVHKLHLMKHIDDFRSWYFTWEMEKRSLLKNVEEIKEYINNTAEKWLQS